MKYLCIVLSLLLAPQDAIDVPRGPPQSRDLVDDIFSTVLGLVQEIVQAAGSSPKDPSATRPFDATSQLVDTTGIHAFQAPRPNDARGPCPGLNAPANHGFLPHIGFANILDITAACAKVYGLDQDSDLFLPHMVGLLMELALGGPLAANNTPEHPAAITTMNRTAPPPGRSRAIWQQFRSHHIPIRRGALFSGAVVSQVAFVFIYRLMGNKSAEYLDGRLNQDVLKSSMSFQGSDDNLTWVPGHDQIPDNWYKRNDNDEHNFLSSISEDINLMSDDHPEVTSPGCNMGKVNSFVEIDVANLTQDAYSKQDELTNPLCFGLAFANNVANLVPVVNFVVQEVILPIQNFLTCKTIPELDLTVAEPCRAILCIGAQRQTLHLVLFKAEEMRSKE